MNFKKISLIFALFTILSYLTFYDIPPEDYSGKKVIVLGFDGLDPRTIKKMVNEGKLPNFSKLIQKGSFSTLKTSTPPQSPVAWSSFITGNNPGKHNVFDFLARDPKTYMPKLTITEVKPPKSFNLGPYSIPLGNAEIISYRKGKPFWEIAKDHGINSTILLVPVTFPPDEGAKMLSGMGVPDILGTNGTFSFYTTKKEDKTKVTGGQVFFVEKYYDLIEANLIGPRNDFLKEKPIVKIPFKAYILPNNKVKIEIQEHSLILNKEEWSSWISIEFPMLSQLSVKGILRFHLISAEPDFALYVSPINLDPTSPAIPISQPPGFAKEIADKFGYFYTQGMPEDTWALNESRISDKAFMELTNKIQAERLNLFKNELRGLKEGLLVSVFVSPDRIQHMFTRYIDSKSPLYKENSKSKFNQAIPNVYQYCDDILGIVRKYMDNKTTLIALSDHGFSYYRRSVHLNTWLIKNGYMSLKNQKLNVSSEFFENIDFSKTQAYALGLNGIYINRHGREGNGIVRSEEDADKIKNNISRGLENLIDLKTGDHVVKKVYDSEKIYSGPYLENAPDLVIGYFDGFRTSWQTSMGGAPKFLFEDNIKKWSGDHLIDPDLVPGFFVSNNRFRLESPSILDMGPTILSELGIQKSDKFDGVVLHKF